MSKKLRFIILGICFVIFLGTAPLLVLFVRGQKLDRDNSRLSATGIIAAETVPSGAEIYLNGELSKSKTPTSLRFLESKDYDVKVSKPGYFSWEKRLTVLANKVTWVNPNPEKLVLIKLPEEKQTLADNAELFSVLSNNKIAYSNENSLTFLSGKNFTETKVIGFKQSPKSLVKSLGGKALIVYTESSTYLVNTDTYETKDLTKVIPKTSKVVFINDSQILAQSSGNLSHINLQTLATTRVLNEVMDFTMAGDRVYALQKNENAVSFTTLTLPLFDNKQDILSDLPNFSSAQIFVTLGREAFILADSKLFYVGNTLEELAGNVSTVDFDQVRNSLVFSSPGELDYFNFDEKKVKLIARSNSSFISTNLRRDINYAFYINDGKLLAGGLDDRDRQNIYTLAEDADLQNFEFLDTKKLIYKNGGSLTVLTVL